MIGIDQVTNGISIATVLLILGLVPGLFQALVHGLRNVSNLVALRISLPVPYLQSKDQVDQPYWFAAAGMLVLLITCIAYLLI